MKNQDELSLEVLESIHGGYLPSINWDSTYAAPPEGGETGFHDGPYLIFNSSGPPPGSDSFMYTLDKLG